MGNPFLGPKPAGSFRDQAAARNLERVAWLMDRAITIPGTNVSVGLDALLGLLPVGGDVMTGVVQAGVVLYALSHYRVPRTVAARMMANVLLDVAVGSIPVLGDLFDVAFKANTRNIKLLEPYRRPAETTIHGVKIPSSITIDLTPGGTTWRYIVPIALILFGTLALVFIGFVVVAREVVRWMLPA